MPDGKEILNDIEFNRQIKGMGDRQLIEFIAAQTYETCQRCPKHDKRIASLEDQNKKAFGVTGGIAGLIGAGIVAALNYFINKG